MYMGATRTQIYLTREQRRKLDERRRREGKTLAAVVRDAVDGYLARPDLKAVKAILDSTYGIDPDFTTPSRTDWARRETRIGRARRG